MRRVRENSSAKTKTPHSFEWGVLFGGADGALLHKRRPRNRLPAIPFSPRREPRRRLPPLRRFLLRKNKHAPFFRMGRFIWRSGRGSPTQAQAAESLASDSLLAPPGAAQAAPSTPQVFASQKQKRPILSNGAFYLAERTGLSYTSAGRGIACKRFPSRPAGSRAGGSLHSAGFCFAKTKTPHSFEWGVLFGGADGARTRDPRRDRPVF